jgi:structural maintenance of chromosome 2
MALRDVRRQFKDGIDTKKGDLAKLEKTYKVVKDQHSAATAALTNNEDLLQSLQTGLAGQSATAAGGGGGYMAQVANARSMHEHAIADEKQAKTRVEMSRKELVDKERRWREVEKDAQDGRAGVDRMGKDVQGLKEKVAKSGWSEHQERESEEALGRARQEARRQRDVGASL